jgi:hypothetical protein
MLYAIATAAPSGAVFLFNPTNAQSCHKAANHIGKFAAAGNSLQISTLPPDDAFLTIQAARPDLPACRLPVTGIVWLARGSDYSAP